MEKKLPKCRECKERFMPFNNNALQPYCMKKDDCISASVSFYNAQKQKQVKKEKKVVDEKVKAMRVDTHLKENKSALQREINKLARMIDAKFEYEHCIDCGKFFRNQIDGAHFHGVGSNNSIRYNLHNIHSAKSDCNQYSDKHKQGYEIGLEKRYGPEYLNKVKELPFKYKEIGLSNAEIAEKLKLARKIVRTFDSFVFTDSLQARDVLNKVIGIYC